MDRCDVLVVGGGPGGSTCAASLSRAGLDVLVLDRKQFPRDKTCAGWITPQVCAELGLDPADYRKSLVMQPIRGFRVELEGGRRAAVDFGEVVSYGIRRCEFDHYLLRRSGARTRLGEPLRELRREGSVWRANGDIEARYLVGAGGHFCPVARFLGARPGETEPTTVVAREIEFAMDAEQEAHCPALPELPELVFTRDLRGYGWVVRKGGWLNVGLGRQDTEAFPRRVEEFLDWLEANHRVPPGLPRGLRGHAYLLYDEAPRPLAAEGVLLVGDSAGLAYGRSGEGIRPAVESGLLAARVLREACAGREPAPEERYARSVTDRFGPRHGRKRSGVTDWIPAPWRPALVARCLASPRFARRVVLERWFLHREMPPLASD